MRLGWRDATAALLMTAVVAPYAAFFVLGRVPRVDNVRLMAVLALVLGISALLLADGFAWSTLAGRVEIALGAGHSRWAW